MVLKHTAIQNGLDLSGLYSSYMFFKDFTEKTSQVFDAFLKMFNNMIFKLENNVYLNKQWLAIGTVWLFHISAIIGISLGFFEFFVTKTPLNLLIAFGLLIWVFPINSPKKAMLTAFFFAVGMFVEYLGVNFGWLFGEYTYGQNLGLKFQNVPWLIGINWAVLVLITGAMANQLHIPKCAKVLLGATLMVILDFPMEAVTPIFDFWEFSGGIAPLSNYIAWFIIASGLHAVFQWFKMDGNSQLSWHLYLCQFVFFTYFYVYYSL